MYLKLWVSIMPDFYIPRNEHFITCLCIKHSKLLSNMVKSIKHITKYQNIVKTLSHIIIIYQLLLNIVKQMLSNIVKSMKCILYCQIY